MPVENASWGRLLREKHPVWAEMARFSRNGLPLTTRRGSWDEASELRPTPARLVRVGLQTRLASPRQMAHDSCLASPRQGRGEASHELARLVLISASESPSYSASTSGNLRPGGRPGTDARTVSELQSSRKNLQDTTGDGANVVSAPSSDSTIQPVTEKSHLLTRARSNNISPPRVHPREIPTSLNPSVTSRPALDLPTCPRPPDAAHFTRFSAPRRGFRNVGEPKPSGRAIGKSSITSW
jgi:hypothetical protein